MGAQQIPLVRGLFGNIREMGSVRQVECVLGIAGGMVRRRVECVEAEVFRLHFRSVGYGKTHLSQDAAHLFAHEGERMPRAGACIRGRKGSVDRWPQLGLEFPLLDLRKRCVELALQLCLRFIDHAAEGRALFQVAFYIILFPGICLSLTVLAVNLVGDGLRDALDPRLARRM